MKKNQLIFIAGLVTWGILSRTIFHLGPNVEFITAISIVAGLIIKNKKIAFIIPVLIMFLSDLVIGNTKIFIFTWSGFVIPVLLGAFIAGKLKIWQGKKIMKLAVFSEVAAVSSSLFFFIWTNFGHWLITNMYTKDLNGLISSYINAIPFLKPQLAGNLIIVPIFVLTAYFILNRNFKKIPELSQV
jgi:hypothetical protein